MFFFCVFLSETARTTAKSQVKLTLAQIRKKLPNGWTDWHQMWHTCADSYGNGYTPNKLPLETQRGGVLGGFRCSTNQKSGEAVKRLDRLEPHLVHVCGFVWEWTEAEYNSPLNTTGTWGGVKGSQIQKSGEAVKRLDRLALTLVHLCGLVWEWT